MYICVHSVYWLCWHAVKNMLVCTSSMYQSSCVSVMWYYCQRWLTMMIDLRNSAHLIQTMVRDSAGVPSTNFRLREEVDTHVENNCAWQWSSSTLLGNQAILQSAIFKGQLPCTARPSNLNQFYIEPSSWISQVRELLQLLRQHCSSYICKSEPPAIADSWDDQPVLQILWLHGYTHQ